MYFPGELRSTAFIRALPKAELHLHLEGTVDPVTLLELRQRHRKSGSLEEIEQLYRYQDFTGFLMAFKAVTEDLRTAEDYELITYRLMEKLKAENILHAEVYVSVGVCLWREQDFPAIFQGLQRGRELGERDFGVSLLWIFDAVRQFGEPAAREVAQLAVRFKGPSVVGFGIGGDERKAGPELFRDVYAYAAENGLRLTIHAGETVGPESIWGGLNLGRAHRACAQRLARYRACGRIGDPPDSGGDLYYEQSADGLFAGVQRPPGAELLQPGDHDHPEH